jgi:hypothetical protein
MRKSQAKTIHVGNAGEHYVAAQLAPYCIVRDVGQGKDTGIDLYCEIVEQETLNLSLHFFCQVKTQERAATTSSIDDRFWVYWGEQPAPVFLFLVKYSDESPISERTEVWVHDVPYILAKRDAERTGKRAPTRAVAETFLLAAESNNKDKMTLHDFVYRHVPWSYGLWHMRRFGLVLPNPEIAADQTRAILVGGFSYIYEDKIQTAMGYASWLLQHEKVSTRE